MKNAINNDIITNNKKIWFICEKLRCRIKK